MKPIKLSFLILVICLAGCGQKKTSDDTQIENKEEAATTNGADKKAETAKTKETSTNKVSNGNVLGYYMGGFTPVNFDEKNDVYHENKITISIDSLNKTTLMLYGHSIVAGNKRPFEGNYQVTDSGYVAKVDEPGDNRFDGSFKFTIKPTEKKMIGIWDAFKKDFSATSTKYKLDKKKFVYDPEEGLGDSFPYQKLYNSAKAKEYFTRTGEFLTADVIKVNASSQVIAKEEIANMHRGDLEVIRNSIYARHGYSFKTRKMLFVFNHVDWYMPVSTDVRTQLTDLEKKNIALLKRYEKHSKRYYDSFGR